MDCAQATTSLIPALLRRHANYTPHATNQQKICPWGNAKNSSKVLETQTSPHLHISTSPSSRLACLSGPGRTPHHLAKLGWISQGLRHVADISHLPSPGLASYSHCLFIGPYWLTLPPITSHHLSLQTLHYPRRPREPLSSLPYPANLVNPSQTRFSVLTNHCLHPLFIPCKLSIGVVGAMVCALLFPLRRKRWIGKHWQ
jgi:hypothetical protein